MRQSIVKLSTIILLVFLCSICGMGQTYDYTAVPQTDDNFTTAHFRIYISDSIHLVRGVLHYVKPHLSDGRSMTEDTDFRSLCEELNFALMGTQFDSRDIANGMGKAVDSAMHFFAIQSGHEELKNAPLLFNGTSWGGQWAYDYVRWNPARVIAFLTHKGGYHTEGYAGEAMYVPGYLFIGERDLDYRITNLTGIFNQHRQLGAPWTIAIEPNIGHESVKDTNILFPYIRKVTELRLPEDSTPGGEVVLNAIDETQGWLGNRADYKIGSFMCYSDNKYLASWLPDEDLAVTWQEFVSVGTVSAVYDCQPTDITKLTAKEFMVYPIPCTDLLHIELSHSQITHGYIFIQNMAGITLLERDVKEHTSVLDVSHLKHGVFILQLHYDNRVYTQKLIVE